MLIEFIMNLINIFSYCQRSVNYNIPELSDLFKVSHEIINI